jgi:hypothetical protein
LVAGFSPIYHKRKNHLKKVVNIVGNEIDILVKRIAMKKMIIVSALFMAITSCGGSQSTNSHAVDDTTNNAELTRRTVTDTTKHPDGIINGSVISTDTAAMNVQNSINKAKEAKKNK